MKVNGIPSWLERVPTLSSRSSAESFSSARVAVPPVQRRHRNGLSRPVSSKSWMQWLASIVSLTVLGASLHAQTTQSSTDRITFNQSIKEVATTQPKFAFGTAGTLVRSELSPAEAQATLDFSVALKMYNFAELQERIGNGEIISLDEMAVKYYPTTTDYNKVVEWLSAQGFTIKPADKYNLSVFASGTLVQIEQAFGTKFGLVNFAGVESVSALSAPSLPAAVAAPVLSINGLQPQLHPTPHIIKGAPSQGIQKLINNQPPYTVAEIAKAYGANGLSVDGTGQKIGIVIDTFPLNSDLTLFWNFNGVSQSLSNIEEVQVVPGTLPSPTGEESLDVEWSSGMAPGAKVRVYATKDLAFVHLDQAFQTIINDLSSQPGLRQISISLGLGELYDAPSQMQTDAQYFASMAGAGVTVFVSSGDGGSSPGLSGHDHSGPVQVESFANDPSVTGVGGTTLDLNVSTGVVSSESAWFGSGGGISTIFARPVWQTGPGVPAGSTRLVPDVALAADPNTGGIVYLNGVQRQFGGTSWSAPTWAGFCAMINQNRISLSEPSVGLLGPKIYPLIGTSSFRDITTGNNGLNGVYNAGPGYNLCTGGGVPNIAALIQALAVPTPTRTDFLSYSGDFNADGKQDILWRNMQTGEVRIWYMNGSTILADDSVLTVGLDWQIVGIGNFDGTGFSDIVWENAKDGSFAIWTMRGNSSVSHQFPSPGLQWSITGIADLDHTGRADLLWRNVVTGDVQVWLSRSPFNFSSVFIGTASLDWNLFGTADLFGDGFPELIWRNQNTGEVRAWRLRGDVMIANVSLGFASLDWKIAGLGDFTGTGRQDILWRNTVDGSVDAWIMNGFTIIDQWFPSAASLDWQIRATPDVNGNHVNSIFWSNFITGQQAIWTSNQSTFVPGAPFAVAPSPWLVQP